MKKFKFSFINSIFFWVVTILLYLPILMLVLFSFNDSTLLVFPLKAFTLKWYGQLMGADELLRSLYNSLAVGLVSSLVSTSVLCWVPWAPWR